jgi:hypothetical protein
MITTLKLDLGPDQLRALGLRLTGKARAATRQQVSEWAYKLLGDAIDFADEDKHTELRNLVCSKCGKPSAFKVPKTKVIQSVVPNKAALTAASEALQKAADALMKLTSESEIGEKQTT